MYRFFNPIIVRQFNVSALLRTVTKSRVKEPKHSERKMVTSIGLPLIIVNGKFQSLGSMTVEDLETFIPFLVKCSVTRAGALLVNGIPEWWSSAVPFKFPLQRPNGLSLVGYRRCLTSIVCSCYWYHDAQYLLPFSAHIANCPESVFLKNNEDNTTSIFYTHNTSHVLKFNNENKDYDKTRRKVSNLRRTLLSGLSKKPVITDIYLCENCDAEFSSYSEMLKHEKECFRISFTGGEKCIDNKVKTCTKKSANRIGIPQRIKPGTESSPDQNIFSYLKLKSKSGKNSIKPLKNTEMNSRWMNEMYLLHNKKVEFSSSFGRKIIGLGLGGEFKKKITRSFMLNEYHCSSCRILREPREVTEYKVTYKKPKQKGWSHQYCFNKGQRRSRHITLKTGLNEESRKLLKQCRKLRVVLNRVDS